jgi:hypothetical protein
LALLVYLINLGGWHMYDDEGGYLYAAWRISQGEMPYRDFLTPQMPLFLYTGAAVMRVVGPSASLRAGPSAALMTGSSAVGTRLLTVGTMLLAAWLLYLLLKNAFDPSTALASLAVFLTHRNVYYMARFFRSEAYMVCFDLLGLYLGAQYTQPSNRHKRWLACAAGAAFALATLNKLFGLLPFAGYVLFLFFDTVRVRRNGIPPYSRLIWPTVGFATVLAGALAPFVGLNLPEFLLGHHLKQGSGLSRLDTALKGIGFLWGYARLWPTYTLLAAVGVLAAWRRRSVHPLGALFLAQLPAAAAFLFISRTLNPRLLIFLTPTESALMVIGIKWVLDRLSRTSFVGRNGIPTYGIKVIAGLLLLALALYPHVQQDVQIAQWRDPDTLRIARLLGERIAPDEYLLCDYPGLNFYAGLKSTYLGAGLSGGAVGGGQITGRRLARELESEPYHGRRWVIVDVSPETGHTMTGLHDYAWFLTFLEGAGFEKVDELARGEQRLRVYRAPPQPLPTEIETPLSVDLGTDIQLLGYHLPQTVARAGIPLPLTLYWRANAAIDTDYKVFVHLLDGDGNLRAQEDVQPRYGRFPTSLWTPGPVIVDEHQFSLPPVLSPGRYVLGVGLYLAPDGPRLPTVGKDSSYLSGDWIALPVSITVR